jgi:hypothetical protein
VVEGTDLVSIWLISVTLCYNFSVNWTKKLAKTHFWIVTATFLAGCSSGAVVFAPTPPPADLSPLQYNHPSGAFSVVMPRHWSVNMQNTVTLASASFAAPEDTEPLLSFAVVNLGRDLSATELGDIIEQYQTQVRADAERYVEQDRQAMGDGSWRLAGLRDAVGGRTQQVNTFIERTGSLVGIVEVVVPDNTERLQSLQTIINSFWINPDAILEVADLAALSSVRRSALDILHVSTWTTPAGVFFITGEVANYGDTMTSDVPVRGVLLTESALGVVEAVDMVMGYGIPPGGFAPFSLRFGQGQPALTTTFELTLGNAEWESDAGAVIFGQDELTWTDESIFTAEGHLLITGVVTNVSSQTVRSLRAVVTVFDDAQNVIAAGFTDLTPAELAPTEDTSFQILVQELGGEPAHYIVNVQGRP